MRAISKQNGDRWLSRRHATPPTTANQATKAWSNFRREGKTREICLSEQFGLCAYSETVLDKTDLGMHLDHVEPKSRNPGRTFDHGNLVLSAIDDIKSRQLVRHDVFGGHFRLNRYSNNGFIHPLHPDSRRFFHYASDGIVSPALKLSASDARKARYTIAILNLNAPILVSRRRHWLEELEREIDKLLDSIDALERFADVELCPTNGQLRPFHSAVRERFGRLGDRILGNHCPQCR
jgi:uncharacterized protein (TIGR02646 family)